MGNSGLRPLLFAVVLSGLLCSYANIALASERTLVYPFETVNVDPATGQAVSLVVATELENQGFTVIDSAQVEKAVARSRFGGSATELPGAQGSDASASAAAAPPASPESSEAAAPPKQVDEAQTRLKIARDFECVHYFTGVLVGLGDQLQLSLTRVAVDGSPARTKKMAATSQSELPGVISRLVAALTSGGTPGPAPATSLPSPEMAAPPPAASTAAVEKAFGVALGQVFGVGEEMHTFTTINFDARFEINRLLIGLNAGIGLGSVDISDGLQFMLDILAAGYLTNTQVAPYMGAGVGMFIGNRVGLEVGDCDYDYDEDCEDRSVMGVNVFPAVGVEFLKNSTMRLHLDGRYLFSFNKGGWGHGPMAMVGINF